IFGIQRWKMKEWSIDWDLLYQNYTNFTAWEGEDAPCFGILFGSKEVSRIHLPLFTKTIDGPTLHQMRTLMSSDLELVGVIRVGAYDVGVSVPKGGIEIKLHREHLVIRDSDGIKRANSFLVDVPGADGGVPRYAVARISFDITLRQGNEAHELAMAYERQLTIMETTSFMTPDKKIISSRSTDKEKSPISGTGSPFVRLLALQCLAPPPGEEESLVPIVRVAKGATECRMVSVPLEISAVVLDSDSSLALHKRLLEAFRRRLDQTHNMLQTALRKKGASLEIFSALFLPSGWSRHLHIQQTAVMESEEVGVEYRRRLHRLFNLPRSFPALRSGQNLLSTTPGLLRDIHKNVKNYKSCGEIAVVRPGYDYYHYMQQGFDDCQWGCAYRSMQTIVSWFLINGLADGKVPTHREIQQCLVDIQDKPANFVGSKKWIGSTELGFVLETKYNIQYKIMTTNSGIEVAERARELLYHFKRVGSPVMIGGGQLAHTILGVDMNVETGEARFLVLDPHYTGRDELPAALSGGCEWKTAKFWQADSFYNLLMPQIPINVI
ncbi:hypothetical protein PENTCL1PPCAC_18356, partial [Pristionchus entomophagus]